MRTLIGNVSGTYAMIFTAQLTGNTRIGEGAELYITYDYDPFAATQMNTVFHSVMATTTALTTSTATSTAFNINLPENTPTTTFSVDASSTNHFWIEFRAFNVGGSNVSTTVGWNAETVSTTTFTQTTQSFSYVLLSSPKTVGVSPNSANTFSISASVA